MSNIRQIVTAKDVTQSDINEAYEIATGYYISKGMKVDWADVWDRMEQWSPIDFGTTVDTPAMRKIQREVRKMIAEE